MADPGFYDETDDPHRPIRAAANGPASESTQWGRLLTLFMRVVAVFWLLQGVMQWRFVLMADRSIFDELPSTTAAAVIFFAVLDPIAGVGMWLATPWGGVLWLLIASSQIFVAMSLPGFFVGGYWLVALDVVLIGLYFALTFEAGRDYDAMRMRSKRQRRRTPPRLDADALEKTFAALREKARSFRKR
jgi:hypothetical protein